MSKYILPTFTGIQFDLLEPTIDMIVVEDIAHHLVNENRFNGALGFSYSVAYHSILVCKQAPEEFKLEALFHDSHEAYYKDFTSPLKNMLRDYYNLEYDNIIYVYEELLSIKFKLDFPSCFRRLKDLDYKMCATEIRQLLPDFPEESWYSCKGYESFPDVNIMERNWKNVKFEFLDLYEKYRRV